MEACIPFKRRWDILLVNAQEAYDGSEYQWASQLSDYILALQPDNARILNLKADALDQMALSTLTATGRNYYQSYAQDLRENA